MNTLAEHPDNDLIIGQVLGEQIKQARNVKNPSAESLVDSVKVRRIIYK